MTDSIEEEYVFKCPRCKAPANACGHWNVCPCGTFNHTSYPTCAECGGVLPAVASDSTALNGGTVTKLELVEVGEGFRFDPDDLLEAAKGQGFTRLAILGENPDGTLWVSGSANAGETVILIELAKHQIIHGE